MPTYFFNLTTAHEMIRDPDGTQLPDEAAARAHAQAVARELMQHRQIQTRSWRLTAWDDRGRPCFDLLFATVDNSLDHFRPELRKSCEDLHVKTASLFDAMQEVRRTLLQVKATLARADGLPYLAAVGGVAVDPPTMKAKAGFVA
jgi:hypothetical protein